MDLLTSVSAGMGTLSQVGLASFCTLLLLAPVAMAGETLTGEVTASGRITFSHETAFTSHPLAGILPDASNLKKFSLGAPQVRVCEYEMRLAEAEVGSTVIQLQPLTMETRCYRLTNVLVQLDPSAAPTGWLGIYPRGQAFETTVQHLESRSTSRLTSPEVDTANTGVEDHPGWPYYDQHIREPHVLLTTGRHLHAYGAGALKFLGPAVVIFSDQNTTYHQTSNHPSNDMPFRERVVRWLHLDYQGATMTMESETPVLLATPDTSGWWDGKITFTFTQGALYVPHGSYSATGEPEWIDGRLEADFHPTGRDDATRMRLQGEMSATSIPVAPTIVGTPSAFPLLLAMLVAGGTLMATCGALLHKRRRRVNKARVSPSTMPQPTTGETVAALEEAAEEESNRGNFKEALALLLRARRMNPRDASLALQEAICRYRLRDYGRALGVLDEAITISSQGAAYWWAVHVALEWGADDVAETYFVRGLEKATDVAWKGCMVHELEGLFQRLADRPAVQMAAAQATRQDEDPTKTT